MSPNFIILVNHNYPKINSVKSYENKHHKSSLKLSINLLKTKNYVQVRYMKIPAGRLTVVLF